MKTDPVNFIRSAIQGAIERTKGFGAKVVVYELSLETKGFESLQVLNDVAALKGASDVIIANRMEEALQDVRGSLCMGCV